MKVFLGIELDETWDEYKNMPLDFLLEDLLSTWQKDGVKSVQIENIKI